MNDTELQELRDWSAMKREWYMIIEPSWPYMTKQKQYSGYSKYGSNRWPMWKPDDPTTGQIWLFLEVIKKERFSIRRLFIKELERIIAKKYPELNEGQRISGLWNLFYLTPTDILLAAKATVEQ